MKFAILCALILHYNLLVAQTFQRNRLSVQDEKEGIYASYFDRGFERIVKLTLRTNNTFTYEGRSTNYSVYSNGRWVQKSKLIILNSEIDSSNVSVKFYYFNTDTVRSYYKGARNSQSNPPFYQTKFQIPINLKGALFPDARIFIDNDSSYCFPYFDTCVGKIHSFGKIKIDFGNGFKTKWITIDTKNFKRILVVVQSEFIFNEYLSFKNHKLTLAGRKLTTIE